MDAVPVPPEQLEPETLRALIEDFVTRDGTDYGEIEVEIEQRIEQVMWALRNRKATIYYDPDSSTCNIIAQ